MSTNNSDNKTIRQHSEAYEPSGSPGSLNPLQVLARHRWQFFGCLLVVSGVALTSLFLCRPKFEAAAQVEVVADQPNSGGGLSGLLGGRGDNDFFATQCAMLSSRRVLAGAAEKLNLPGDRWAHGEAVIEEMRDKLKIEPISGSRLINIIGVSKNASEAAAIANQVAVSFIESSTAEQKADSKRISKHINAQIARLDKNIRQQETVIGKFRRDNMISGNDSALVVAESQIMALNNQLNEAVKQKADLKRTIARLSLLVSDRDNLDHKAMTLPQIAKDAEIVSNGRSLAVLEQEEAQLARVYLHGHAKLKNVRMKISDLRKDIFDRKVTLADTMYDQAKGQHKAMLENIELLKKKLVEQRQLSVELTNRHQQYKKMLMELEMLHQSKGKMVAGLSQYLLEQGMHNAPVVVVESAHVPAGPPGLHAEQRAAVILLLGLLFSVAFVISLDRFSVSDEFESAGQIDMHMTPQQMANWSSMYMPVVSPVGPSGSEQVNMLGRIGNIDFAGTGDSDQVFAARCRVVQADQRSRSAETFRNIGVKLLSRFGQTRQSVVLTGTSSGSGKTTCACNLALMLSQTGRKVVLVDIDQQGSDLERVFAIKTNKLDALVIALAQPEDYIQETDVENLAVMQIEGNWKTSDIAMLNNELTGRFDWVIYDAGVLSEQSTGSLLQAAGKALFVSGPNDKHGPLVTVEQIEHYGAVSIGCMENIHTQTAHRQQRYSVTT